MTKLSTELLEKMKKKLAIANREIKRENKSDNINKAFIKLKEGVQELRILPMPDGDSFLEFFYHYLDKRGYLCLSKNWGMKCPICNYASELWNGGDKDEQNLAKQLFAKERYLSPAIRRGEEELGPRIFGYGLSNYKKLVAAVVDPEYGDITDVDEGRDLKITFTKAKTKGAYDKTEVDIKPSVKSLSSDKKQVKEWLATMPDIQKEAGEKMSFEEMDEVLEKWIKSKFSSRSEVEKDNDKSVEDVKKDLESEDDIPF